MNTSSHSSVSMIINIQILRGLAALWVFIYHSLPHFKAMGLTLAWFESLASVGYMGVDLFFVISGLVIAKSMEKIESSYKNSKKFYGKRLARIYLGYWPLFILTALTMYLLVPEHLFSFNLIKSFFLLGIHEEELFIPAAWSLPYELYFYTLMAVFLAFKLKNIHVFFGSLLLLVLIKVNVIAYRWNEFLDLILSPMVIEFILGFYLWRYKHIFVSNILLLPYTVLMLIALYFSVQYELVFTAFRAVVIGGFAVCLVAISVILEGRTPTALIGLLKPIGDSSYTLYLLHFQLINWFFYLGARDWFAASGLAALGYVLMIVVIILFSYLFYRIIEKPVYEGYINKKVNFQ